MATTANGTVTIQGQAAEPTPPEVEKKLVLMEDESVERRSFFQPPPCGYGSCKDGRGK